MKCERCDGTGWIEPEIPPRILEAIRSDPEGYYAREGGPEAEPCDDCDGAGHLPDE